MASNPAQRLSARFTPGEARLESGENSVGLRLSGYGYGNRLLQPSAARLAGSGNRIEYQRGNLTEWYVNSAAGVEQGFTLAARPGNAEPGERLTIALEVTGGLRPVLAPGGDTVLLESDGTTRLRYTGLRAWDAAGRTLSARLEVLGQQVRLRGRGCGRGLPSHRRSLLPAGRTVGLRRRGKRRLRLFRSGGRGHGGDRSLFQFEL